MNGSKPSLRRWSGLALVALVVIAGVLVGQALLFASEALQNAGFEDGLAHWEPSGPAGNWAVVGSQTPSMYPTYTEMGDVTITPPSGEKMLRLGVPQGRDKHQARGLTTVEQRFMALDTDRLAVTFRLFSWEHREGRDAFTIDIRDSLGNSVGMLEYPVEVSLPSGKALEAGLLPYSLSLDIGAGSYLDSDWVVVRIKDIPKNELLTLSYTLNTDRDAAHDSWVYVDWWNTPPVAQFDRWPEDNPHEGDAIGMNGEFSTDPDADLGDEVVAWNWKLTRLSDSDEETATGGECWWIAPEDSDYRVELTVMDSYGATDTTATVISVEPFEPAVNAINAEVFSGKPATLVARTLDQGWSEEHSISWSVAGASGATIIEDHAPALSSGLGTADFLTDAAPGATLAGEVVVSETENSSASGSDPVTVRVVPDDPNHLEGPGSLNDLDSLPDLASDWSYLSFIQSAGDIDLYEVKLPDGTDLKGGTEVLATLSGLPADYDLVLLATTPSEESPESLQMAGLGVSPWANSPWKNSPWKNSPWKNSPWKNSPWKNSPWHNSPWKNSPWKNSPWKNSPWKNSPWKNSDISRDPLYHMGWTHAPWKNSPWKNSPWKNSPLDGYPIAGLSYTGLDPSTISGTDMSPGELGLDLSGTSLRIAATSANRGSANEAVLGTASLATTRMFVAVVGHNRVYDQENPYRLQIETSVPVDLVAYAAETITHEELVPADKATSNPVETPVPGGASPKTLFVTQRERMEALYGDSETDALYTDLETLCENDLVRGTILSVPSTIYDDWDLNPGSIDAANAITNDIRARIRSYLDANESIEYVVLVGNDRVVPHRRVVDETVISNERDYASDSGLEIDSPLYASIYGQFNLTDDYYTDRLPTAWQGRALYIPDTATSRLVETPAEMRSVIAAFNESGGTLAAETALVTGYDFMADGARAVADTLESAGMATTIIDTDDWTGDELREELLGSPDSVSDVSAHFTHFAGLSAQGFLDAIAGNDIGPEDLVTALDLLKAEYLKQLKNRLVFSMGCHAGLSVPDGDAFDPAEGEPDFGIDFPQTMASQGAVYLASTGYGLGDTEGLAGTEKLMAVFAADVTRGEGVSVGQALVDAKKRYLLGLSAVTTYDEKSSIQFTLYGLPQYRLDTSGASSASEYQSSGAFAVASMPTGRTETLHLTVRDGETALVDRDYTLTEVQGANGSYFTLGDDAQVTADRPIQPSIPITIPRDDARGDVHGFRLTQASGKTFNNFDPAIARHTTEWEYNPQENQVAVDGWWPAEPATLNTIETLEGPGRERQQQLVVVPAQFKAYPDSTDTVTGDELVYNSLVIDLTRSTNESDFTAPTVSAAELSVFRNSLQVSVVTTDTSGIGVIDLTDPLGNVLVSRDFAGLPAPPADAYLIAYTPPPGVNPATLDVQVRVADVYGNTTAVTGKGVAAIDPVIDTLPPLTEALGVPEGWTNQPSIVTLQATDNEGGSGVASTWYGRDQTPETLYLGGSLTFGESGIEDLSFYSVDVAGNHEVTQTVTVRTDFTTPVTTSDVRSTYLNTDCVINITATDTYSGVQELRYWLDGNGPFIEPGGNATTGTDQQGPHVLQYQALDYAGNLEATQTVTFSVTNEPPALEIVWVSTQGDDANTGGFGSPLRNIQTGINRVTDGGTVYIASGQYNEDLTITRPMIVQRQFGDQGTVQLAGTGEGPVVTVSGMSTRPITLRWLEISGGGAITPSSGGGGVRAVGSMVVIDECTIANNMASAGAGVYAEDSSLMVFSSVITDNDTVLNSGPGGGIYAVGTGQTNLRDCTVANNVGSAGAGGLVTNGPTAYVLNTAFWDNAITGTGGTPENPTSFIVLADLSGPREVYYSYTTGGTEPGEGNIGAMDPGFANASAGDYTLTAGSPLIDTGATSYWWLVSMPNDRNFQPRPVGFGHDIGAYEYQMPLSLQLGTTASFEGTSPASIEGAMFGYRVAVSGDLAVIGSPHENADYGGAYVYRRIAGAWTLEQRLEPFTGMTGPGQFGSSVALDGQSIVVGAPGENVGAGAVYVFRQDGSWGSEIRLVPSASAPNDQFGSGGLDVEGDRVVVGAPGSEAGQPVPPVGPTDAGAVYVFEKSAGVWGQTATIVADGHAAGDRFGEALDLEGDMLWVGAAQADSGGVTDSGIVQLFRFAENTWSLWNVLASPSPVANGRFGCALDIQSDRMVIGERRSSSDGPSSPGRAYLYENVPDFLGDQWFLRATLGANDIEGTEPDGFGTAVGIDGRHIVVGASGGQGTPSYGAAYLFDFYRDSESGLACERRQVFRAPQPVLSDTFGISVGISGTQLLVGSPRPVTTPGAAYFFGYPW